MVLHSVSMVRRSVGTVQHTRRFRRGIEPRCIDDLLCVDPRYVLHHLGREPLDVITVLLEPKCVVFDKLAVIQPFFDYDVSKPQGDSTGGARPDAEMDVRVGGKRGNKGTYIDDLHAPLPGIEKSSNYGGVGMERV